MITVGTSIQNVYVDYIYFLDSRVIYFPLVLILFGILVINLAAFGVFGAIRESVLLTNIVSVSFISNGLNLILFYFF